MPTTRIVCRLGGFQLDTLPTCHFPLLHSLPTPVPPPWHAVVDGAAVGKGSLFRNFFSLTYSFVVFCAVLSGPWRMRRAADGHFLICTAPASAAASTHDQCTTRMYRETLARTQGTERTCTHSSRQPAAPSRGHLQEMKAVGSKGKQVGGQAHAGSALFQPS